MSWNKVDKVKRVNINSLKFDTGERLTIRKYHPNEHDAIRRMYLQNGPFQPKNHQFPQSNFYGNLHR